VHQRIKFLFIICILYSFSFSKSFSIGIGGSNLTTGLNGLTSQPIFRLGYESLYNDHLIGFTITGGGFSSTDGGVYSHEEDWTIRYITSYYKKYFIKKDNISIYLGGELSFATKVNIYCEKGFYDDPQDFPIRWSYNDQEDQMNCGSVDGELEYDASLLSDKFNGINRLDIGPLFGINYKFSDNVGLELSHYIGLMEPIRYIPVNGATFIRSILSIYYYIN